MVVVADVHRCGGKGAVVLLVVAALSGVTGVVFAVVVEEDVACGVVVVLTKVPILGAAVGSDSVINSGSSVAAFTRRHSCFSAETSPPVVAAVLLQTHSIPAGGTGKLSRLRTGGFNTGSSCTGVASFCNKLVAPPIGNFQNGTV